ncbi:MAG: glycosyltransferase family 9 protein, partial [Verrucomicrobiae bacterium]|nr:glycosyltransferase family 9 protein [Verrucomicrobiae bacterium]
MKLRLRDSLVFWAHRGLAAAGRFRAPTLEEIRAQGFRRTLVVATTAMGDAVLCTPLLDSLRAARPDLFLGFWVGEASAPLFHGHRGLDALHVYRGKYRRVAEALRSLRHARYDLALVANANDPDVIPLIWWSGCRRILRRPQRDTIYRFLVANPEMLDARHTTGHAADRNLEFCDLLGLPRGTARLRLDTPADAASRIVARMADLPRPWWVLHPGASRREKLWGVENFAALTRRILRRAPGTVLLTGSPSERKLCARIQQAVGWSPRIWNLAGRLGLEELAALLSQASLLVSGDTGVFHVAVAMGSRTVTLFAPWDTGSGPEINGPVQDLDRHVVLRTSRSGAPITEIDAETVYAACRP